jgi:hypothetical protein
LTKKALEIAAEPVARDPHPEHAGDEGQGEEDNDHAPDFYTAFTVRATFAFRWQDKRGKWLLDIHA